MTLTPTDRLLQPSPTPLRLLVLDIDGTIAGQSNDIREPVLRAIQAAQAQGVQVAIATGRMYRGALRFHQAVNSQLPLLAYQGAWIQTPGEDQITRHLTVPGAIAADLIDQLQTIAETQPDQETAEDWAVHAYINDQLFVQHLGEASREYARRSGVTPHVVGDLRNLVRSHPVTKLLALNANPLKIQALLAQMRQRYPREDLYLTTSVETFLEATHPSVNKGAAVQYLAETILGLQPHQVMAIGDNFNDLEMLEYAGLGVAMGNAPPQVQAIADWVAPTVEEDGVAIAIQQHLQPGVPKTL